jgi:ribosome maturation factor RimP
MIEKLEPVVKEVCASNGVGLYDIELKTASKGQIICIYITKIGGVNVDDCIKVNRELSAYFEENEPFKEPYFLEVSSPGLERSLKFKKHYLSAINESVKINYMQEGISQVVTGKLVEVNPDMIILEIDQNKIDIPFSAIKKARTVYVFGKKEKS